MSVFFLCAHTCTHTCAHTHFQLAFYTCYTLKYILSLSTNLPYSLTTVDRYLSFSYFFFLLQTMYHWVTFEYCESTSRTPSTGGQISALEWNCCIKKKKKNCTESTALYNFDEFLNFPPKIYQYLLFEGPKLWSQRGAVWCRGRMDSCMKTWEREDWAEKESELWFGWWGPRDQALGKKECAWFNAPSLHSKFLITFEQRLHKLCSWSWQWEK